MANLLAYGKKVVGLEGEVKEWKLIDTVADNVAVTIPNEAKEVIVQAYGTAVNTSLTIYLLTDFESRTLHTGDYYSSQYNSSLDLIWDKTARTVLCTKIQNAGTRISTLIKVYAR